MPVDHLAAFREKFRLDDLTFHEVGGWILSVRPEQITLGSMVISNAAGRLDLAALDDAEGAGLARALGIAERAARELFGAVRINVLCLMMKDPVVHFHVLPRYDGDVERYGQTWTDRDWPGPPTIRPAPTSDDVLQSVTDDLRDLGRTGGPRPRR